MLFRSVLNLIDQKLIVSCHDISLGGILVAVAKMSIKGNKGLKINSLKGLQNKFEYFFSEDQGRYIVEIKKINLEKVVKILNENSVHFDELGTITKDQITFDSEVNFTVEDLSKAYKTWLKNYILN